MFTNIPGRASIELPAYYPEFAWYYPNCELETKAWFVTQAQPEWVYFDCGANIGYYSILFALLSPAGAVHAFEPTSTADQLSVNLQHHGLKNVHIHRLALGDRSGRRIEGIHRMWGHDAERLEYDFTTVDEVVGAQGLARLDCIKIDVDSYDFEVLRGAEQTLARFDPWVIIELSESLALRNTSPCEVFTWLEARGYTSAAMLDAENFLLKRSASGDPGYIPFNLLRWATEHGTIPILKRETGRPGNIPAWARSGYAAHALIESTTDHTWMESCREMFDQATTTPAWQLFQYACVVKQFAPDLIIELGGWNGDTTRALVAGLAGACSVPSRLVSFKTNLEIAGLRDTLPTRFATGQISHLNITLHARPPGKTDIGDLASSNRVLVFANDPSPECTQFLLGQILPGIADRPHLVVVGSISDGNYSMPQGYAEQPGVYALHDTHSSREDLPALVDFTTRNQISFFSADRSLHSVIGPNPQRVMQLSTAAGPLFSLQAHWRWFSLNERDHFPHFFP